VTVTTDLLLVPSAPIATAPVAPAVFRSSSAPPRRTLVDIFDETVRAHPGARALDHGGAVLTYRELADEVDAVRAKLAGHGIGAGDRVGVRVSSGTAELYLAILGVLAAGAAYVPVDADDPEERAELVFAEADVSAVLGDGLAVSLRRTPEGRTGRGGPAVDPRLIIK
jgi:non-ribosomal peptide synthetase component F